MAPLWHRFFDAHVVFRKSPEKISFLFRDFGGRTRARTWDPLIKSQRVQMARQCNDERYGAYEHPVVLPHVSHFMQVPFRTSVKFMHSPHISPS